MANTSLIVICGPTASGKSQLAIDLAKQFNGEVVNADTMSFYRNMNIGTAKVMPDEMQGIPHHMIDVLDTTEDANVAWYQREARKVIDDIIAYRNSDDDIFLVPNAANCSKVFDVLKAQAPAGIELVNLHEKYAVIAVQGPESKTLLESLGLSLNMDYMAFSHGEISGNQVIVCRTGYSGEHGYEVLPKWGEAGKVWDVIVSNLGDGLVCGLGARDTLRTEMGYPLHGNELSEAISANVGGAAWAIAYDKDKFNGDSALRSEKEAGIPRRLRGLKLKDRGIPRGHMSILVDGKIVGETTSGTFSPTLKVGIALGLVDTAYKLGDQVTIDVRGRELAAEIVKLPMVAPHVK